MGDFSGYGVTYLFSVCKSTGGLVHFEEVLIKIRSVSSAFANLYS